MDHIFPEVVTQTMNWEIVCDFFNSDFFVLNSLGGNNNNSGNENYASVIHRDVRFYTSEAFFLNSIICVSPINEDTGATEIFIPKDKGLQENFSQKECEKYKRPLGGDESFDKWYEEYTGGTWEENNE